MSYESCGHDLGKYSFLSIVIFLDVTNCLFFLVCFVVPICM